MSKTRLLEMSAAIVKAFVSRNALPPQAVPELLREVHDDLKKHMNAPSDALHPPVPINETIKRDFLISLEDGKPYKSLNHHLRSRGLTPELYRKKWGLSPNYPMIARSSSERRSAAAIAQGFGRSSHSRKARLPKRTEVAQVEHADGRVDRS